MNTNPINFFYTIVTDNPIAYFPAIIIIAYSAAFLLYLFDPKNRNILILISIPILVSIIGILLNSYNQICIMISDYKALRIFMPCSIMLLAGGYLTSFQVKYMLVSHIISSILHICLYCYCKHYDGAGLILDLFHPALTYLVLLAFVHFFVSHFLYLKKFWNFTETVTLIDRFLPTNELSSRNTLILLQACSMIIHSTFMTFLHIADLTNYWLCTIVLFVMLFQLLIITISLRIMHKHSSSANVAFYISAHLMIIKILVTQIVLHYEIYRSNKSFCLLTQYFSNKLIYLFLSMLICNLRF
jgi:hypothetical protein